MPPDDLPPFVDRLLPPSASIPSPPSKIKTLLPRTTTEQIRTKTPAAVQALASLGDEVALFRALYSTRTVLPSHSVSTITRQQPLSQR